MKVEYVPLDPHYPTAIRSLADAIHETLGGPQSAVDIGGGEGMLVARLSELGWAADAVDGSSEARARAARAGRIVYPYDVTEGGLPRVLGVEVYAVAICTEVAEHIPAEHADTIVWNVAAAASRFIVWSAAVPGQDFPGHVNLQPPSYWLHKFAVHGWYAHPLSQAFRRRMREKGAQHMGAADNFYVLALASLDL